MGTHLESVENPWLCVGDFNIIREASDKVGGQRFTLAKECILISFIDRIGGLNIGSMGVLFTQNNRDHVNFIREKLDHAICSSNRFMRFSMASVLNLLIVASNHAPILLDTDLERDKLCYLFKFIEAWCL